MQNPEVGGFVPEIKQNPLEQAQERWSVDLNDDRAVLTKLAELQGKMPDVADLGNLWRDHQEAPKEDENIESDENIQMAA